MRVSRFPTVQVVCHTTPNRLNEDAWLAMQSGPLGDTITIAAIDGATTRLTPPPLQRYLDSRPDALTPAAYAARLTRDSLARQAAEGLLIDLRARLIAANDDLSRGLINLFGALTLEAMNYPQEVYNTLAHDPRLIRLGLPACVVTLAEYDPAASELHYAHAGDTLLLVAYEDGRVSVPTHTDTVDHDVKLKRIAYQQRQHHPDLPFRELLQQPEIRSLNLQNGLRHNYVDEHGLPQPAHGTGVINGLPDLRYFIKTNTIDMDHTVLVCAMTDGLEWPASANELFTDDADEARERRAQRHAFMVGQIIDRGLSGYLDLLREAETEDPNHEEYPRMKTHDDATGVLLRFA
ncbi:MAG: hypothetical protein JW966_12465 [Anaerolineae bacterium]|nr:hypothetical protein [Anaerolineae bacterium]